MISGYTKKQIKASAIALLACMAAASTGLGQTWTWNPTSGTNWGTAANWSPASVPTEATNTVLNFTNGSLSNNNLGAAPFTLNQVNINRAGGVSFSLTGNQIQFAGTTPQLNATFSASGQDYTISNNLNLAAATTFNVTRTGTSGPGPTLILNGVISGANSLRLVQTVAISTVGFVLGNAANSFSGGLTILGSVSLTPGATVNIGATGNSYLGSGSVTINNQASGNNGALIIAGGALTATTYNRNTTIGASNNVAISTEMFLVGGTGLTTTANYTFTNSTATADTADLILQTATGTISSNGATFTAGGTNAVTGNINFASAITANSAITAATGSLSGNVLNFIYSTIGSNTGAGGWAGGGNNLRFSGFSGSGSAKFTLSSGAMAVFENTATALGGLNSIQVAGQSGGDITAGSLSTNVARVSFIGATFVLPANGLQFISGATQVSPITPTLAGTTLTGNILLSGGAQVAFQGEAGSVVTPAFNIGGTTPNTNSLTIGSGSTAAFDIAFRDDSGFPFFAQMNLYSATTINAGGSMVFRGTQNIGGSTYNAINVRGNITGQGTAATDSILSIENTVGSVVLSAALSTTARQVAFNNAITLFVQGSGTGGLRVQGSSTNVNALLTNTVLSTQVSSVGSPSSDQGTLTIAYTDNGTRTFTNASGPTTASWIKLGFDAAGGSPTYTLSSTGGNLGNWNGLVIKGGTVALGASGLTFNGASAAAPFILLGGTLSMTTNNVTFTGLGDLQAGTINGTTGTLTINGNVTKSTSGVVNLNGNINILGSTGLTISGGILNQQASNLINNTARMVLAGGTWATSGFSETLNTLTLTADSNIDLGAGASIINFANSSAVSWTGSADLYITNWSGNAGGGGTDQVYFGTTAAGLTAGQLNQIFFYNPAGFAGGIYSAQILSTGEIVPLARVVPEPSTVLMGVGLAGAAIAFELRRRRRKNAEESLDSAQDKVE